MNRYSHFLERHGGVHPRPEVQAERELAIWAAEMGMLCENGELPAADRERLHRFPNWADTPHERRFLNRVQECEMWVAAHDG